MANGVFFIVFFLVYRLCTMLISIFTLRRGAALDWLSESFGGSYCSRRCWISVIPFVIHYGGTVLGWAMVKAILRTPRALSSFSLDYLLCTLSR